MLARWRQTLVAALGVTFSITMFIALLGFMVGLNELLDDMILNRVPHIRLFNQVGPTKDQPVLLRPEFGTDHNFIRSIKPVAGKKEIHNSTRILESLRTESLIDGIAPRISEQVFFNAGAVNITGVIIGLDPKQEKEIFHFSDYVTEGTIADLTNVSNSIILGKALAADLFVEPGDFVHITTSSQQRVSLKVVGFAQFGLQEIDKVYTYVSLSTAQKVLGKSKDYITEIGIHLTDMEKAPALAKRYTTLFNTTAQDIQSSNAQFETGTFIRTLISYAVGVTLLIVAGFGIYNILNMMIYEKMDSIAILKATGFSGRDVNRIFIIIALGIGLSGGLLGLVFGFLLSLLIDGIPFRTDSLPTITTYPVSYNPAFYTIACVFSIVTTYLSGWAPARKASKVDPVVIIRGK